MNEREKTYGEAELLANPNLVRIREKRNNLFEALYNKHNSTLIFNDLMLAFIDKSLEKKYTKDQLREYAAFHIFISSGADFSKMKTNLPRGDSVEEFLDDQLAKIEEDKKEK
ncbi:MAG: hypothetical protein AAB723_00680 [Patescibacteria group bacterium]